MGPAQYQCADDRQGSLGTNAAKRQNEPNCSSRFSMTSLKHIEANRRNALKSTGHETGLMRIRAKHGMLSGALGIVLLALSWWMGRK